MDKYTITISRQFASMGRTIGQNMARELGIGFYDRDIMIDSSKYGPEKTADILCAVVRKALC